MDTKYIETDYGSVRIQKNSEAVYIFNWYKPNGDHYEICLDRIPLSPKVTVALFRKGSPRDNLNLTGDHLLPLNQAVSKLSGDLHRELSDALAIMQHKVNSDREHYRNCPGCSW